MRVWTWNPEALHEPPVRLGITVALSGAAVWFFGREAAEGLAASAAGALLVLAIVYVGYHQVGMRRLGRLWPGAVTGVASGLLFYCLCPPGLPLWLLFILAAVAVLVEGGLRGLRAPVALGGVVTAWLLAWLWHAHSGLGYLSPFQLRPQPEPIQLWSNYQLEIDPLRLYTGNVAGPLGATSFGLAMMGFVILAYMRRTSWLFLGSFYLPVAATMALARQSLPVYLLCGPALIFAGLIAADNRGLPPARAWRVGAGAAAGLLSALLLLRGGGSESYGAGILTVLLLVTLFQLFGLAGLPAAIAGDADQPLRRGAGPSAPGRLAALVMFAPVGLLLVWRDHSLPRSQRQVLAVLGLVLYMTAVAAAVLWLWALRLPV